MPEDKKPAPMWLWVAGPLVLLLFIVAIVKSNSPEAKARAEQDLAIEMCWKEQARKSLTPQEARFVAGACERMEADAKSRGR